MHIKIWTQHNCIMKRRCLCLRWPIWAAMPQHKNVAIQIILSFKSTISMHESRINLIIKCQLPLPSYKHGRNKSVSQQTPDLKEIQKTSCKALTTVFICVRQPTTSPDGQLPPGLPQGLTILAAGWQQLLGGSSCVDTERERERWQKINNVYNIAALDPVCPYLNWLWRQDQQSGALLYCMLACRSARRPSRYTVAHRTGHYVFTAYRMLVTFSSGAQSNKGLKWLSAFALNQSKG